MLSTRLIISSITAGIFLGCGGSGPSARITRDYSSPYFHANVVWDIAKDFGHEPNLYIQNAGWCTSAIELPKSLIKTMAQFGGSVKIGPGQIPMTSQFRPLHSEDSDKWFMHEMINIDEQECTNIFVYIEYRDLEIRGTDWLKTFPSVTIQAEYLKPQSDSNPAPKALSNYPHVMWRLRRCPKNSDVDLEYCQIMYKDEKHESIENPNTRDD